MALLTEPTTLNTTNYALAAGTAFYRQRNGAVKAVVMHVTAGLQDLGMTGTDESAEGTNRWALSTGARVSWHRISDSDGVERCLPSWAVAWHAKGYNSNTVGLEISNRDAKWAGKPAAWIKWTTWYAALAVADWVVKYKIPLRRATKAELDKAIATNGAPVGFIDHSRLSDIRVDPGADFPWTQFFGYVKAIIGGATHPDRLGTTTTTTTAVTGLIAEDGLNGPNTRKAIQRMVGVTADGSWGPATRKAIQTWINKRMAAKGWKTRIPVDGNFGPATRRGMQAVLGLTQTGIWAWDQGTRPDPTTKALQKAHNTWRRSLAK